MPNTAPSTKYYRVLLEVVNTVELLVVIALFVIVIFVPWCWPKKYRVWRSTRITIASARTAREFCFICFTLIYIIFHPFLFSGHRSMEKEVLPSYLHTWYGSGIAISLLEQKRQYNFGNCYCVFKESKDCDIFPKLSLKHRTNGRTVETSNAHMKWQCFRKLSW